MSEVVSDTKMAVRVTGTRIKGKWTIKVADGMEIPDRSAMVLLCNDSPRARRGNDLVRTVH